MGITTLPKTRRPNQTGKSNSLTYRPICKSVKPQACNRFSTCSYTQVSEKTPPQSLQGRFHASGISRSVDRLRKFARLPQLRDRVGHREKRIRAGSRPTIPAPHPMRPKLVHHGAARENQAHCQAQHTPLAASHPCVLRQLSDESSAPASQSGGKLGQLAKPDKARFQLVIKAASRFGRICRKRRPPVRWLDESSTFHHPDVPILILTL